MNRKIDDLINGRKEKRDKKSILVIFFAIFILIIAVFGLIIVSTFVGYYVAQFSGKAGYVYELVLEYHECATFWSGVAGAIVMVPGFNNQQDLIVSSCGMYEANFLFDCLQPGMHHIIMASLVPPSDIDWSSIEAASSGDVDNYIGIGSSELTSANKTFTQLLSFQIGAQIYSNVPGTRTKANVSGEIIVAPVSNESV